MGENQKVQKMEAIPKMKFIMICMYQIQKLWNDQKQYKLAFLKWVDMHIAQAYQDLSQQFLEELVLMPILGLNYFLLSQIKKSQINNSLDYGIISEEDHLQLHNIFEEHRRLERMKTEKINKILKIKQLQDQLSLGDFRSFQPLPQDESNPKTFPIKKKSVGTFIDFQYTRQQAFINQNRQKSWFGEGNQFSIINQNTASDNYYKIK
eukprot:TRINITY_DN4262_c0_g1_i2.p1 TRINITY_DN4262_c0_g1~~TRINITY_DN4262_c0_g1_i2.p1  ORF type:complete len:207 (-),score=15.68 TRINITY_DN4262_c0_g1_i2:21-641(-)